MKKKLELTDLIVSVYKVANEVSTLDGASEVKKLMNAKGIVDWSVTCFASTRALRESL